MIQLQAIRKAVTTLQIKHAAAVQAVADAQQRLATAETNFADALEARKISQEVAKASQTEAAKPIIEIVTRCLAAVFPDPYTFDVRFASRRGKTEVDLIFQRGGFDITPVGGSGGGAIEVAAFGLRLAVMMLARPPVQRVMILDEPFTWVSSPDRPRLKLLLEKLIAEMQLQIIQITHLPDMEMGNIIRINNRTPETEDDGTDAD